jgi:hypothetical protein
MTPKQERIVVEIIAWVCVIILVATAIIAVRLW